MPPRSTKKENEEVPSSRRSARLAPSSTTGVVAVEKGGKKRSAEVDTAASKKAKVDSSKNTAKNESKASVKGKSNVEVEIKSRKGIDNGNDNVDEGEEKEKEEAPKPKPKPKPKSSSTKLEKGDTLPSIKLENEDGEEIDISTLTDGGKGVVIFVYPKADTPGCTNQACGFRDHLSEIKELGYGIYGLSKDKPAALKRIKKELNYTLLSDPESKLIKRLGAFIAPNNSCRSHFIFDKQEGKLMDIAIKVKPADETVWHSSRVIMLDPSGSLGIVSAVDAK